MHCSFTWNALTKTIEGNLFSSISSVLVESGNGKTRGYNSGGFSGQVQEHDRKAGCRAAVSHGEMLQNSLRLFVQDGWWYCDGFALDLPLHAHHTRSGSAKTSQDHILLSHEPAGLRAAVHWQMVSQKTILMEYFTNLCAMFQLHLDTKEIEKIH